NTIKYIFNNYYINAPDWASKNFTLENVANTDINPLLSLAIPKNRMFFIGADGYIHGYIYNNGTYSGGNWLTVSPSYAAQIYHGQNVTFQVIAGDNLVVSPDGLKLLY